MNPTPNMEMRKARFFKGLSQYDVAFKTGIPQSRLSLIERGYSNPKENERKKIAKVLGTQGIFSDNQGG